jgi:hypothetical protein
VLLAADGVGLGQPGAPLGVDLVGIEQAKLMQMVARREGLDPAKARVLERRASTRCPSTQRLRGDSWANDMRT